MIALPPPPPQVYTVIAYTCTNCLGVETYHDELDGLCACHECVNGLMTALVPWPELVALSRTLPEAELHAAMVAIARQCRARQPVLTHNTASLPIGQLPAKPRIPLQRMVPKPPRAA